MKENEAAIIIQKCVRRYLQQKQRAMKSSSIVQIDNNNLKEDEVLRARKVLDEVNLFYRRLHSNLRKKEEIRKLCRNIDEVSKNLKAIKKLEDCKEVETSFCDNVIMESIKERHREQIRQSNLRWWEKLDIYEVEEHFHN